MLVKTSGIQTVKPDTKSDIGVAMLIEGAWQQGYYWLPGMEKAVFFDKPKSLANDVIWFTNAPYDAIRGYGNYFKSDRFFRIPVEQLIGEIAKPGLHPMEKASIFGPMISRMGKVPENHEIRSASSLAAAMSRSHKARFKTCHSDWDAIGQQAHTWTWQGSVKHRLLMGGSLYAPRQESVQQILGIPVPDFSKPPKIVSRQMPKDELRAMMMMYPGFVSARIEKLSPGVQDFISLNRTVWSTIELLWLMDRADITTKTLYLSDPVPHPCKDAKLLDTFKPYSWLDGLRLEALFLSPGGKANIAMDAYLRSVGHVEMAMHAEYLGKKAGISAISLAFNKIGIACSSKERAKVHKGAINCGLLPDLPKELSLTGDWKEDLFDVD